MMCCEILEDNSVGRSDFEGLGFKDVKEKFKDPSKALQGCLCGFFVLRIYDVQSAGAE